MIRFNDVDNRLHKGRRGEEFTVVLSCLHGECHQEIFIDAAKDVAAAIAERFAVEDSQDVFQQVAFELGVSRGS